MLEQIPRYPHMTGKKKRTEVGNNILFYFAFKIIFFIQSQEVRATIFSGFCS